MKFAILIICLALTNHLGLATETYHFDSTNSFITIHLGTAGLLRSAGHEHLIRTPVRQGTFVFAPGASQSLVEAMVDAGQLQVVDPEISLRDREEIQATMQSARVLDVKQFPTITFKSSSIEPSGDNQLSVRGNLTIKGHTSPITIQVTLTRLGTQLKAVGKSQFKQTQFGIKPVTAGLGTVKVRDLMDLEFVILTLP